MFLTFPILFPSHVAGPTGTPTKVPLSPQVVEVIWKVESSAFENLGKDHWVLQLTPSPVSPGRCSSSPQHLTSSLARLEKLCDLTDSDRSRSAPTENIILDKACYVFTN